MFLITIDDQTIALYLNLHFNYSYSGRLIFFIYAKKCTFKIYMVFN